MSLTQSGGIAGVMLKVTVSSDGTLIAEDQRSGRTVKQDLTTDTVGRLGGSYPKILLTTPTAPHSGCADCFIYDLRVTAGGREALIHADDTTLAGSGAEDLIRILQGLRDAALRS